jgi:hypothetical protein
MKPARTLVARSPHRNVGAVHAPWMQPAPIEWESFRERAFIRLAILCPAVAQLQHQPFEIKYSAADGEVRRHTPDFLVTLVGGMRLVIEVKMTKYVEENRAKFDGAAEKVRAEGGRYYVITERMLNAQREDRANVWRRYARGGAAPAQIDLILNRVRDHRNGCTLAELVGAGAGMGVIHHMLGRRMLIAAKDLQLTPKTRLNFPNIGEPDERVYFDSWFGCSPWGENVGTET